MYNVTQAPVGSGLGLERQRRLPFLALVRLNDEIATKAEPLDCFGSGPEIVSEGGMIMVDFGSRESTEHRVHAEPECPGTTNASGTSSAR